MTPLQNTLYTIQSYELAVDKARKRSEEIESILENDAAVQKAADKLEAAQETLTGYQTNVKDLELEITSLAQKIEEVNNLLYSGELTNPKELQDRQNELASLRRRKDNLDNDFFNTMNKAEDAKKAVAEAQKAYDAAVEARDERNRELLKEMKALKKKIKQNLRERKTTLKEITDTEYKTYRKLRKRMNGQAVATLVDENICSFCRVGQTTSAVDEIMNEEDKLIYCGNCGRILVSAS